MELQDLKGTCSCYHLYNVDKYNVKGRVKDKFFPSQVTNNKAIIYFTNFSWRDNFKIRLNLWKQGFRQISSYKGFCDNKVYILLAKKGML